jgi:hypothetical protein
MGREPKVREREPEETILVFVGAIVGFAVSFLAVSIDSVDRWLDDRNPLPEWSGIPLTVAIVIGVIVWSIRRRHREMFVISLALIPVAVAGNAIRILDPNPAWAETLRALGFAFFLCLLLVIGMRLGGRLRELEKAVFNEASSLAFFITVVVAALYGFADGFLGAPRLSFLWLPVIGGLSWVVAWGIRERRYS